MQPGAGWLSIPGHTLDSTHIMSNIATLTRLGLFCDCACGPCAGSTQPPWGSGRICSILVCARDLYRLVPVPWHDCCPTGGVPAAGAAAAGAVHGANTWTESDGRGVPVALKDPKQVSADSLQSPHDPDVTYSSHKGKGYEVQVAETCHEENATQLTPTWR